MHYAEDERPEEIVSYASLYEVQPLVSEKDSSEIKVDMQVNGHSMPFTVDTASAVSIVGEDTYNKYLSLLLLQEPQINLKGYTGHEVKLLGQVDVAVNYEDQKKVLPHVIAKGDRTSLFGRSWIAQLELDWGSLFSGKLGSQELKEGDTPKSHQVPCALMEGEEISVPIDSLVEELPDSLLSIEKQPTETKERRDEQLCYQDSRSRNSQTVF